MTDTPAASDASPESPEVNDTPTQAEPASSSVAEAEASADWKASLPEDLRADPALRDIKDVTGLAKSMIHAQKLVGMDRDKIVTVPGEDADEGTREEFYRKIGRPETAKDYALPVENVQLPEGVQRNEEMEAWYKDTAHKFGLSAKQAAGLYQEYMTFAGQSLEAGNVQLEQMRDKVEGELKKEWGAAYETRMKQAVAPLKQFADEDFVEFLNTTGLGSHPSMIKFMHKVSTQLGEDSVSDPSRTEVLMTPAEAQAEIAKKYSDKTFMEAYTSKNHPSHKWAVEEMSKLYKYQVAGA
jgi:hypothetical protein